VKPILENARAHQDHQDLIDGNPGVFVHRVQAVKTAYDLLLIEERDLTKKRAATPLVFFNFLKASSLWKIGEPRV
jgi:hypothetical protein